MDNRNYNPLNEGYTASKRGYQGTSEAPKKITINIQSGTTQSSSSEANTQKTSTTNSDQRKQFLGSWVSS